ncbi:MAG: DUF4394 domain-containing protein [Roseiflexaceae bacterium]|nr:DUF4394 domain-containing protein [Roseiflexaceae bacterium]
MAMSCRRLLPALLACTLALVALARPAGSLMAAAAPDAATTIYLLSNNSLVTAKANQLAQAAPGVPITSLTAGDTLVAIDVRPQTGRLYGLGHNSANGTVQLYHITPSTGIATAIGVPGAFVGQDGTTVLPITGAGFGFDFNPTVDRIRIVTATGLNFRMNPNNGALVDGNLNLPTPPNGVNPDGPINGATSAVDGTAYTNSAPNVAVTTQYTIDSGSDRLFIQNPPNSGTQTAAQAITLNSAALDFSNANGFDIPFGIDATAANTPVTGEAYAALTVGGTVGLYRINLASGAATALGTAGLTSVQGLAVRAPTAAGVVLNADGTQISRFLLNAPQTLISVAITGVTAGEKLVGIDARPATGQLYALGVNAAANTASVYVLDPQLGAATVVGTASQIAFVDAAGAPVDLPADGYGIDFNPTVDRLRVVTGSGLNFRINQLTGVGVDGNLNNTATPPAGINTDGPINGGATGVEGTAYTNAEAGATATTQYALGATTNSLFIQNLPNSGTQTAGMMVTLNGAVLDFDAANGFDIPQGVNVAASNAAAVGQGYAALTAAGATELYQIDLSSGVANQVGPIGSGAAVNGLVIWNAPDLSSRLYLPLIDR